MSSCFVAHFISSLKYLLYALVKCISWLEDICIFMPWISISSFNFFFLNLCIHVKSLAWIGGVCAIRTFLVVYAFWLNLKSIDFFFLIFYFFICFHWGQQPLSLQISTVGMAGYKNCDIWRRRGSFSNFGVK